MLVRNVALVQPRAEGVGRVVDTAHHNLWQREGACAWLPRLARNCARNGVPRACTSALQSLTVANGALQGITGFLPTALLVSPPHSDPNPRGSKWHNHRHREREGRQPPNSPTAIYLSRPAAVRWWPVSWQPPRARWRQIVSPPEPAYSARRPFLASI
jgi:hypothetical protein